MRFHNYPVALAWIEWVLNDVVLSLTALGEQLVLQMASLAEVRHVPIDDDTEQNALKTVYGQLQPSRNLN
jgi:hypothetical protein